MKMIGLVGINQSSAERCQTADPALPAIGRRRFSTLLMSLAGLSLAGSPDLDRVFAAEKGPPHSEPKSYPLLDEAISRVIPEAGFQSRIALKDSIVKLAIQGVIDEKKFRALYGPNRPIPGEFAMVLRAPSNREILLTENNAADYVNLLWPVGLATHMAANSGSPLNGDSLFNFASTGGWTLGKEPNGGTYFNKLAIVGLTEEQEARVVRIAKATYRPCCNNSTFFQDCNHGSAMLGLLQLGASQGLSDSELYREALAFNSFWFADYYVRTALLFKVVKKTEWGDVDPRVVMGYDYSAGGPWQQNVAAPVAKIPDLFPPTTEGGAACGL
jgi:hypothetical protein